MVTSKIDVRVYLKLGGEPHQKYSPGQLSAERIFVLLYWILRLCLNKPVIDLLVHLTAPFICDSGGDSMSDFVAYIGLNFVCILNDKTYEKV